MNRVRRKPGHRGFLKQYSLALALLALCGVLALKSPAFLTGTRVDICTGGASCPSHRCKSTERAALTEESSV